MADEKKPKLSPIRDTVEDWGPDKEEENLQKKSEYSQKMARQAIEGEPDFETLLKDEEA